MLTIEQRCDDMVGYIVVSIWRKLVREAAPVAQGEVYMHE
jgi:hypothetical protein